MYVLGSIYCLQCNRIQSCTLYRKYLVSVLHSLSSPSFSRQLSFFSEIIHFLYSRTFSLCGLSKKKNSFFVVGIYIPTYEFQYLTSSHGQKIKKEKERRQIFKDQKQVVDPVKLEPQTSCFYFCPLQTINTSKLVKSLKRSMLVEFRVGISSSFYADPIILDLYFGCFCKYGLYVF